MKKMLLLVLTLATACENDAITYANLIDPKATCSSRDLYNKSPDTAICRFGGKVWWCSGGEGSTRPRCEEIALALMETP